MKKFIFIYILSIGFSVNASHSEHPVLNQLSGEVQRISAQKPSLGRDTTLIFALWELTYYANYFKEDNSKALLDSLERLVKRTPWQPGEGLYLFCKTNYLLNIEKGHHDNALKNALHTLDVLKGTNNLKVLAYAHLRVSSIMMWAPLKPNDPKDKFSVEGIKHAQTMVAMGKKLNDPSIICHGLAYVANHYIGINKSKEALAALTEAEQYLQKNKVTYFAENLVYGTAAGLFSSMGNEAKTIEYIDKCLVTGKEQNDNYSIGSMLLFKGELLAFYSKNKDLKNGVPLLEEAYEYVKKLKDISVEAKVENLLYLAYKMDGRKDKALTFLELYKYHEDSLSRSKTQKVFADYDLLKKETQIKNLENEKLLAAINLQKWVRNGLIIGLLGLVGFLYYFFRTNQKLTLKNKEIEEALLKGQTIERKRVATELHDNLSAKISGIRMRLEAIEPDFKAEKQKKIYESSVNALAEVYTDVRLISHNLLPAELETKGLYFALENLVNELNSLDKIQFNLEVKKEIGRFSNKIEYELFSIILELSNNILKHSGARTADIKISHQQNQLELKVEDDGKGFTDNPNSMGMGMKNVKSRVDNLKGNVEVLNNEGVKVAIKIPV